MRVFILAEVGIMRNLKTAVFLELAAAVAICLVLGFSLNSCSDSSSPTDPADNPVPGAGSGDSTSDSGDSGSGDSGGGDDGTTTTGTLAIKMIDEPTEEICQLVVYIKDIRVKPDGESPMLLGTDIGSWDLLSLTQGVEAPLGTWVVDAGVYQFIEMLLDESRSHVIERNLDVPGTDDVPNCFDDIQTPLQIPSEKFKVNGGPFSVATETTVTIDFDAKNSLKRKGSPNNPKGWQLNPKVSIVEVDED